ncbi:MAG TPA: bifunctional riboflavin kinase/FAD synthetase [Spongiibacteraceae bacterium]|nr:bifunctional riboflavin kinase/FAD synthetase [Spongiibacteraceae bacterium]
MELIRGLHNLRPRHRGCVVTVGAFDGVHRGHQAVLRQLIEKGRELNLPTTVILFEPLPREYFAPLQSPPRLMSFQEKVVALRDFGIDRVLRVHFDRKLSEMNADEFVRRVFIEGLGVRYSVIGDDMRFGHDRQGDVRLLRDMGARHGFEVVETSAVLQGGERISSTRIRAELEASNFAEAERLLGRPYAISGRVMVGQQLGRTIDVPTANLHLRRLRAPLAGVYAVEVHGAANGILFGVANVGTRPTIGDLTKAILEVHIFNFSENLYHRHLKVVFRKKLRDEQKFPSLDALKQQIACDMQAGRAYFSLVN